ncbi:extracellular solute-binding protein [Bifidobacterium sp. ESL0800]|uniref:extracellular solute-binding protein n=1 Tax=Bifidobacterium sp. ESL0800 TaxID=2983236 RepID=UPI0023F8609F|nr:extracellular solute-binding protein [Bifidobacterium sp. ESL0800]WEV75852.1 extracellular solute-binding protein [Bifidobacterium sp. ESL0800]
MKTTGKITALIAAASMLVGMAGCGSTPGGGSASSDGATMWGISDNNFGPTKQAVEQWNSKHSDQKINAEYFANDSYKKKIRTSVGAGNAPTMIYSWGGATLRDYAKAGEITDVSKDLNSTVKSKVFKAVADEGYIDGKLYGIPTQGVQPVVLYINKKVLADAGVKQAPKTWDELLDAVAKLKAAGKTPIALAGGSQWPYLMWASYLVDRIGGPEVFQRVEKGEKGAWSDPAITRAMTMIQELVKAGAFGNVYSSMTADDRKDTSMIVNGTAGMELMGSWTFPDFKALSKDFADSQLAFAPFPSVKDGKGDPKDLTGNLTNYWSVSSKAKASQQKSAIAFLKDTTYSSSMVDQMLKIGAVPPVKNIESKVKAADGKIGFYTWVYDAMANTPAFQLSWDQALPSAQAEAVLNNLEQVFLLSQTPDQFVEKMNATIK